MRDHIKHLEHIKTAFENMKEALASSVPKNMITAAEAIKQLNAELMQINQATEGLIAKNHLTEEEAGYERVGLDSRSSLE